MSFPSSGFESVYRNDIDDVANLLKERHDSKFIVINLSGRTYDYTKFNNNVKEFPWEDHHSPPLELLFQACQCIHEFLQKDRNNVAVVHCVAGKGRTGTLISCYLLYSGRFETTEQALQYYKVKRFESGGGVTQPSQVRYVNYFGKILHGYIMNKQIFSPLIVRMDKLVIHGIPWIAPGYFSPYVEIYSVRDQVKQHTTDRVGSELPQFVPNEEEEDAKAEVKFVCSKPIIMTGDILMRVYHKGAWSSQLIFRFGFSTAFLEKRQDNKVVLPLTIRDLDPDSIRKDERFPLSFRVEVHMTALDIPSNNNGPSHAAILDNEKKEKHYWQSLYKVLEDYKVPTKEEASMLLFKDSQRDDSKLGVSGRKSLFTKQNEIDRKFSKRNSLF